MDAKTLKIFISQPMDGKTREEIEKERQRIIDTYGECFNNDFEVIDSIIEENKPPLWCLGEAIKRLSDADCAIFAKDWGKSRGCNIEHKCAVEYGIATFEEK